MRGRYVVAGAVVLSATVLPVLAAPLLLADPPVGSPPAAMATGDPVAAAAITCDGPARPAEAVPEASEVLGARMCATGAGFLDWYAPQDALHDDLTTLVRTLGSAAAVEPQPGTAYCPDVGGRGFDLRLALTDGTVLSVPGDTDGCGTLLVAGREVPGAQALLDTFVGLVEAQRERGVAPGPTRPLPLRCGSDRAPAHVLSLLGDPHDLVRAVSCWRRDEGGDLVPWHAPVPLTDAEVAAVVADLDRVTTRGRPTTSAPCGGGPQVGQDLVGQTASGDVVAIRGHCATFLLDDPARTPVAEQDFWHPTPDVQRLLDDLRR